MKKYCDSCGTALNANANNCPNCGKPLGVVYNQQPVQVTTTNSSAIVGFIISLFGFFTCGIASIVSLILCIVAYRNRDSYVEKYSGLAIAGIVISAITMVISLVTVFVSFILPALIVIFGVAASV